MNLKLYKKPTPLLEKYLQAKEEGKTPCFIIDGQLYFFKNVEQSEYIYSQEMYSLDGLIPVYCYYGSGQESIFKQLEDKGCDVKIIAIEQIEYTEL